VTVTGTEGSASHSASVTVTVGSVTTGNIVANPGFENGVSPWKESSTGGFEIVDPSNPHAGTYSAYLCGYDNCNDQIWQTVKLPSSFTTATFSYWTYIDTSEVTTTTCYDNFHARLRTSSGTTIATVQTQCNLNSHGWTHYTFTVSSQLSAYKGQSVQVYFQGTTDVSLPTDFFVDDVSLSFS
jgi:kumamolisin